MGGGQKGWGSRGRRTQVIPTAHHQSPALLLTLPTLPCPALLLLPLYKYSNPHSQALHNSPHSATPTLTSPPSQPLPCSLPLPVCPPILCPPLPLPLGLPLSLRHTVSRPLSTPNPPNRSRKPNDPVEKQGEEERNISRYMELYMDEKWKLSKKGSRNSSCSASRRVVVGEGGPFLKGSASMREGKSGSGSPRSFSSRCASLVKEQRARFYIMRRCVTMLICWRDYP